MKRKLTMFEMEYVLSGVQPPATPHDRYLAHVARDTCQRTKRAILRDLTTIELYPDCIPQLKEKVEQHYYKSLIEAGDTVGITMAQSIGERQTQLALNSFHSTGITTMTVVTGVPRFTELINATRKPRHVMTTIFCNDAYSSIQDIRQEVGFSLKHVLFSDLIVSYQTIKCSRPRDPWYRYYTAMVRPIPSLRQFVRFHLNPQMLFEANIWLKDVAKRIEQSEGVFCVHSPMTHAILDVWVDENDIETKIIPRLKKVTVHGVPNITELNYTTVSTTGEWYIEAMGENLQKLFAHPRVDETRTFSNNMWEIYTLLGVEATRDFLVRELMSVISVDAYINQRHVELLVDLMLASGTIMSISRYGIQRNQVGPLAASSFEESLEQFLQAGFYGERDGLTSVSASIICGKMSRAGTGACDLVFPLDDGLEIPSQQSEQM